MENETEKIETLNAEVLPAAGPTAEEVQAAAEAAERERKLNRAKNALWRSLKSLQPGYEKDLHNLDALNGLSHWLVGENYNAIVKGKGIFLQGPVGTGKTDLMMALSHAIVRGGGTAFKIVNAKRIEKEFNRSDDGSRDRTRIGGDHVILHYANIEHLCIDDIGMELDGVHYGRSANIIAEIIALRYEKFRRGSNITHLTSNADPEQMEKRYDLRTLSRINEMCGEIYLGGPDRRRTSEMPKTLHVMPDLFSTKVEPPMPTDEEVRHHFAGIKGTIAETLATMESATPKAPGRQRVAGHTQEGDLEELSTRIATMTHAEIVDLRNQMVFANGTGPAMEPFLAVIDAELRARVEPETEAAA